MSDDQKRTTNAGTNQSGHGAKEVGDASAPRLLHIGETARAKNRREFECASMNLCRANSLARNALLSYLSRNINRRGSWVSGNQANQLSIVCCFVQGISTCEAAIMDGLYIQAGALLRQEHEIVSRVQELEEGLERRKKVARADMGVLKKIAWVYGQLSKVAHLGEPGWVTEMSSIDVAGMPGLSLVPVLNVEVSSKFLFWHIGYVLWMTHFAAKFGNRMDLGELTTDEEKQLERSVELLVEEGFLKLAVGSE